jgi:ribosomal 50S subunit-recycling heat shock protein
MLNIDTFIVKEGNTFYLDLEDYNSKSDIIIEDGDMIRFTYEDVKYTAKVVTIGTKKNPSFILNNVKKS